MSEADLESLCERLKDLTTERNPNALAKEAASAISSLQARITELTTERDSLREMVPMPLNAWGAKGYEVAYSREGPGATPRWCLHLNGVGSIPLAWFYRKADAERVAAAEARITELEGGPANRVGAHLLRRAKEWGWLDDGEGAFEYVSRRSYEQGREDADSRALLAEAQVREAVEVLEWIEDHAPATQETSLAHEMADRAASLLQRLKSPSLEGDSSRTSRSAHASGEAATEGLSDLDYEFVLEVGRLEHSGDEGFAFPESDDPWAEDRAQLDSLIAKARDLMSRKPLPAGEGA